MFLVRAQINHLPTASFKYDYLGFQCAENRKLKPIPSLEEPGVVQEDILNFLPLIS